MAAVGPGAMETWSEAESGVQLPSPWQGWDPRVPLAVFNERKQAASPRISTVQAAVHGVDSLQLKLDTAAHGTGVSHPAELGATVAAAARRRRRVAADDRSFGLLPDTSLASEMHSAVLHGMDPLDDRSGGASADEVVVRSSRTKPTGQVDTRRARVFALLADESASAPALKRELRRMLVEGERTGSADSELRETIGAELAEMSATLAREVGQLQRELAYWKKAARGGESGEVEAPAVEAGDAEHDVLRSGAPGQGAAAERAIPAAGSRFAGAPPMQSVAGTGGGKLLAVAADLTRRQQQAARNKVEAATTEAKEGEVLPLLALFTDSPFVATAAVAALDQLLLLDAGGGAGGGTDGNGGANPLVGPLNGPLKLALHAACAEAQMLALLADAPSRPSELHHALLGALDSAADACAVVCVGIAADGGAAALVSLLDACAAPAVPPPACAQLLPRLLLLLSTVAFGSPVAADNLRNAGCVQVRRQPPPPASLAPRPFHPPEFARQLGTYRPPFYVAPPRVSSQALLPLLERPAPDRSRPTTGATSHPDAAPVDEVLALAVQALKALRVERVAALVEDKPRSLAALRTLWAADALFRPVAALRDLDLEPPSQEAQAAGHLGGLSARERLRQRLQPDATARGKSPAERGKGEADENGRRGKGRRERTAAEAKVGVLVLRARADRLKRLDAFSQVSPFLVVSIDTDEGCPERAPSMPAPRPPACPSQPRPTLRGSFKEVGRTDAIAKDSSPAWDDLELRLPSRSPAHAYLRFSIYDWQRSGRHRFIGHTGSKLEELLGEARGKIERGGRSPRRRGGGAVLQLTSSGKGSRGILMVERCQLEW